MATFSNLAYYFQAWGVVDFLLPFLLVFTIIFAVMQKTKILGDKKQFNVIIALVLGLLFVTPHITGSYPLGYDPVQVMNSALPSISLVAIAAIMLLLLMGIFSTDFSKAAAPVIAVVAIGFVVFIFGAALNLWQGPYDVFNWWTAEVTELLIILLVFGLLVWFITKDDKPKSGGNEMLKSFAKMFEKK
ncbi:hypothetical protein HN385_00590 [archaeon]|jgi:hypothetical protein|nr:hypothetical protein [archaeon]MBT3451579.1 hypothetical protein [archaeon]MBT6869599.1 hypothetical protein [archaeon]MBT7192368.1 hypothetical protein [archaeon]MBT7380169.1 hypothetical protein [archaeon]